MKTKKSGAFRSAVTGISVLFALLVYSYGFQVTKVDLEQTKSEHRREQLFRILRALARPDILVYEQSEVDVSVPVMVPCPEGGYTSGHRRSFPGVYGGDPACGEPAARS
jgi:hypothetical protein